MARLQILDTVAKTVAQAKIKQALGRPVCAVYIIGPPQEHVCKIGIAHNPLKRLSTVQTGNWVELKLWRFWWTRDDFAAAAIERGVINQLPNSRVRRGEWFRLSPDAMVAVVQMIAAELRFQLWDDNDLEFIARLAKSKAHGQATR